MNWFKSAITKSASDTGLVHKAAEQEEKHEGANNPFGNQVSVSDIARLKLAARNRRSKIRFWQTSVFLNNIPEIYAEATKNYPFSSLRKSVYISLKISAAKSLWIGLRTFACNDDDN